MLLMDVMNFQTKVGRRNTSKTQVLEYSKGIECNDVSETNNKNKDDTRKNISEEKCFSRTSENDSCIDNLSENISEDTEYNNNSDINDSNREDLGEKFVARNSIQQKISC